MLKRLLPIIALLLFSIPAHAVPTLVQCLTAGGLPKAQTSCSSVTTCSKSFSSTPSVNNVILFDGTDYDAHMGDNKLSTVTDNQTGNTYSITENVIFAGGTFGHTVSKFMGSAKVVGASGTFTMTLTFPTDQQTVSFNACEWTWPDISVFAVDQHSNFVDGGAGNMSCTTTNGSANSNANDFVYAASFSSQGQTVPPGYTDLWEDSTVLGNQTDYKIVSGIETSSAAWPLGSAGPAMCVLVTFNATPAAGAASNNMLLMGVQ